MHRELNAKRGFFTCAAIAVACALAGPAAASAADTYADAATGNDGDDCTVSSTPCATIGAALAQSGAGDTTFVADGTYQELLTLDQGKSLRSLDSDDPKPVIDGGSFSPITIDASGAGEVSGLRILSTGLPMDIQGTVTVESNVFDQNPVEDKPNILVRNAASGVVIHDNSFVDPDEDGYSIGITVESASGPNPEITDNVFDGLGIGIALIVDAEVSGNTFSGAHPLPGTTIPYGAGIFSASATPTIAHNTIGAAAAGPSAGVYFFTGVSPDPIGGTLTRNRISGNDVGVLVPDTGLPVSLNDDLIYANGIGIQATDTSGEPDTSTQGDVVVTNATIFDNDTDVQLDHTTLTLDSTIVGDPIDLVGGAGACEISYSSGSSSAVANGCDEFDYTGDPKLDDPSVENFHLLPTSPLVDAGNPADPGVGALDYYGGPRQVQGKPCSEDRRDIGADEFDPPATPACHPDVYVDPGSPDDSGSCATPDDPCETIGGALYKAADEGNVFLSAGTYNELVSLGGGRSLLPLDEGGPRPVIDGGTQTALTIEPTGAGTVSGLRILSGYRSVDIGGSATLSSNLMDENPTSDRPVIQIQPGTSGVEIRDNDLIDPDAADFGIGVLVGPSDDPVIAGNRFDGLGVGALSLGGDVEFTGNDVGGVHGGVPGLDGIGFGAVGGIPTVVDNTFHDAVGSPSTGIALLKIEPSVSVGVTARRNVVETSDVGVKILDADFPVTLEDNLIDGNGIGLQATDTSGDPDGSTQGDVSATNATIYANGADVQLDHTTLTLDSSIVGDPIDLAGGNGACSITYSRGSATDVANGCGSFDTNADPGFVDAASGNFHLLSSSHLVDVGNPASPGSGATDVFGVAREVQGKVCASARRDIGAAEYQPPSPLGCPSPAPPAPATTTTADPPLAKIEDRPEKRSDDRSPTFDFSSDISDAHFRCRLDTKKWKLCTPPVTYSGLTFGNHRFKVYAIGPDGVRGKAQVFKFRIVRDG